jgi:hypothetical protein
LLAYNADVYDYWKLELEMVMKKEKVFAGWKRTVLYVSQLSWLLVFSVHANQRESNYGWIAFGYSPMIYTSSATMEFQNRVEIDYCHSLSSNTYVKTGVRLKTDLLRPEGFVRLTCRIFDYAWHPEIGVELGYSGAHSGNRLPGETPTAFEQHISPLYFAVQTSPFLFQILKGWELNVLELQIRTHLDFPGRNLKMQIGIVSIGRDI